MSSHFNLQEISWVYIDSDDPRETAMLNATQPEASFVNMGTWLDFLPYKAVHNLQVTISFPCRDVSRIRS